MIRPALTEIGIFLIPFAVYALFLIATRSGLLVQSSWPIQSVAKLALASLRADRAKLDLAGAFFRRLAEFDLHPRPYRERQARSRS